MSELQKLQNRVASAFKEPAPEPAEEAVDNLYFNVEHPETELLHSLEPDPYDLDRDEGSDRHAMLRYWLAGGGLVASSIVLSLGTTTGFLILALCLGAIGIAAMIYSFAERLENRLETRTDARDATPMAANGNVDLTQDVRAASEALIGSIHDALGDLTLCRSLDGVILSANDTFRRVTKCESPVGKTCAQLGIRLEPGEIEHRYEISFGTGEARRAYVWHDIVSRDPLLGDFIILSIARDVTAERQDALQRDAARTRAEEESTLKSRLIATVSHEIRTPLSGLLGMGQLLAATDLSAEQRNYIDGIAKSGTALVQLVEDLLDFSMLSAGRFKLNPRKEAVRPLIESAVEMLASRAHAKGIEIGSTIAPELPEHLIFDPARLRQVLYNVIGNAVKFTEAGGVLVSATLDGSALVIRVRDTGPGMNDVETQRIFGEFEQGDLSRAREGGVGLGLAISARIMAETGGMLTVESKLGQGSTFVIRWPVGVDAPAMRNAGELAGSRVLVFAPVGPAAAGLATTLKALGADTAATAATSEAAALLATHGPFSDIIVDHRLDGEFRAVLSHDPSLSGVRRIFLVNPESRPADMSGTDYDSWLIRPLREQSLIDVLTGKLRGLEPRPETSEDFPMLAAVEEPDAAASNAEPEWGLSILIGEDDPVNAMISQAILEKAGHRVLLADTFAGLGQALGSFEADILLTDYTMPDGTSDEFIRRLRDSEKARGVGPLPVIVLTADATDETRRKLLRNGADLVLVKPAGPDVLHNAIARLSERLTHAA
jgi:signal transduction histidine kinase/CheY-like chemotaxis protein